MSIEAWANAARNTTPNTAADTISLLYEPLIKRGSRPSPVATLWDILCDAVRALVGNKELAERLVNLLLSISQLPDVIDEHGRGITPEWSSAGVYWRNLPELAMIFREYAKEIEPQDEMEGNWDKQAVPLLNATNFGALYLARDKESGMEFHAEISLMEGIELPYQTADQHRYAAMYVPPAATWILFAGENIRELCERDYDRKDGAPGSIPDSEWLWGKGRGYSLDRWALWKKRFGEIAMTQGLQDGVKEFAARASSEMSKIEWNHVDLNEVKVSL